VTLFVPCVSTSQLCATVRTCHVVSSVLIQNSSLKTWAHMPENKATIDILGDFRNSSLPEIFNNEDSPRLTPCQTCDIKQLKEI
jgi:hypothetical protein